MIPDLLNTDEKYWYVLNYVRKAGRQSIQKEIEDFNNGSQRLELFAPLIRTAYKVKGKVVFKDRLLTHYYIFVKGLFDDVKKLCINPGNDLSLMLDRGSDRRYGILSDAEMENFKIIARVHTNTIPFYNIEDIELEEGDTVEVVSGDYAGLKGIFMPKSRSNKGNLVIAATADRGAVIWDIDAKFIRILEFARDTKRQYDLIDSFIPKFLPILRKFHAGESLTDKDKSTLSVFNQRMGVVTLNNHKLEAKLLAALMAVQTIIGDSRGYQSSLKRFEKRKSAVTNSWTNALMELMLSVSQNDLPRLRVAYTLLQDTVTKEDASPTKSQQLLLSEFRHYLTLQ